MAAAAPRRATLSTTHPRQAVDPIEEKLLSSRPHYAFCLPNAAVSSRGERTRANGLLPLRSWADAFPIRNVGRFDHHPHAGVRVAMRRASSTLKTGTSPFRMSSCRLST